MIAEKNLDLKLNRCFEAGLKGCADIAGVTLPRQGRLLREDYYLSEFAMFFDKSCA